MLKLGQEAPPWPQQSKEQRGGCQRPSQGEPNQDKGPSEVTAWSFGLFPNVEMAAFSSGLWSFDSCKTHGACTTSRADRPEFRSPAQRPQKPPQSILYLWPQKPGHENHENMMCWPPHRPHKRKWKAKLGTPRPTQSKGRSDGFELQHNFRSSNNDGRNHRHNCRKCCSVKCEENVESCT